MSFGGSDAKLGRGKRREKDGRAREAQQGKGGRAEGGWPEQWGSVGSGVMRSALECLSVTCPVVWWCRAEAARMS